MRIRILSLLLLLATLPAQAQVSVNPSVLDSLAPPKASTAPTPTPTPTSRPAPVAKPPVATAPKPVAPTAPGIAANPPPNVSLPPALVVPTRPAAAVPPPAVAADAPTRTEKLKSGLRVVFGTGRSDLSPASEAALHALVRGDASQPAAPEGASFTVTCFAAGTAEDPSTTRRLSLSRALAVRSALMSQGVASVRIYVRAFGPTSPGFTDGPPDRADVVVGPNPVATSPTPTKS
jgi:outer membrane protein OmpA-like peptidoglycan-associated protein